MVSPSSDSQNVGQDGAESDGAANRPRGNRFQRIFRSAARGFRTVRDRLLGRPPEAQGPPPTWEQANLAPQLDEAREERNQARTNARWANFAALLGGTPDLESVQQLMAAKEAATSTRDTYKQLKGDYKTAGQAPPGYVPEDPQPGRQEGTSAVADELPAYQQEETVEERRASVEIGIRRNEEAGGRGGHGSGLGDDSRAL